MDYEKTMKKLVCDAMSSGDGKQIESLVRWSVYTISVVIATSRSHETMEELYGAIGKSMWATANEVFDLIETHKGGPAFSDPEFARFMLASVRGLGNG